MQFQNNLAALLDANGSTQTQLAEALDINRANVSRWVTGEREITKSKVDAICDALNCTIEQLYFHVPAANEHPNETA